jgi:WD40 repeat protein
MSALLLLPISAALPQDKKPDAVEQPLPEPDGSTEKATLVLNPLGHVGAIKGVFFTPDGAQLISVGVDKTVQYWDVAGGQRVKVLHLPYAPTAAALTPDGKTLALGRWAKKGQPKVLLVNLEDSRVLYLIGGEKDSGPCKLLTFSPDGNQLAGVVPGVSSVLWRGLQGIWEKKPEELAKVREARPFTTQGTNSIRSLAFSPDGKQLAVGCNHDTKGVRTAFVLEVPVDDAKPAPDREATFVRWFHTPAVAWSPDGQQLATATDAQVYFAPKDPATRNPIRLWSTADRTMLKEVGLRPLAAVGLYFLNAEEVLFTHYNWNQPQGHGQKVLHLTDPKKSRSGPFLKCALGIRERDGCPSAVSADGKLAAFAAGELGDEMVIWETATGKELRHLGGKLGTPRSAGWSKDGSSLGFDAFDDQDNKPLFRFGLDLKELQLREKVDRSEYLYRYRTNDDWSVKVSGPVWEIKHGDKAVRPGQGTSAGVTALALSPRPQPDYVAWGAATSRTLILAEPLTGKWLVPPWGEQLVFDLAPSPDGRFLLAISDRQVAHIYRIASNPAVTDRTPLLSLFLSGGEWVLWTREGYYAASPGGEKLIGFAVDDAPDRLPSFSSAERSRAQFHRPEVIRKTLELGSSIAAIRSLDLHVTTKNAEPALNPLGHVGALKGVSFTPDGKQLVTVGKDKTVQLWDVGSGERLQVLHLPFEPTTTALAPDGKTLAVGRSARQGQRVLLVNPDDGRLVWLTDGENFDGQVTGLAFSADGDQLAAVRQGAGWGNHGCFLWDGLKGIWQKKPADMPTGRQITRLPGWGPGTIPSPRCVAFSPDGKRLAVGCDYSSLEYPGQKRRVEVAFLVDVPVGDAKPAPAVPLSIIGHAKSVVAVAWTPNGEQVVTAYTNDGPAAVEVWSTDGKRQRQLNLGMRPPLGLHFLDGGRLLLTWFNGAGNKKARGQGQSILTLGDDLKEERKAFFPMTGPWEFLRGAVTADGKVAALAGGNDQNEVLLWDVATGEPLHKHPLGSQGTTPRSAGWSKDGRSIALDAFGDNENKKPRFRFALDLKELQLSENVDRSDYYFRYRAHDDKSVQLVSSPGPILELRRPDQKMRVPGGVAFTLTPARDANWFASSSHNTLHLCDLATGKEIFFLHPRGPRVYDLAASPDGRWLLAVNNSQVAHLYRIADDPTKTEREPLLYLFVSRGDWILWTREGYYAASPGGERQMGWTIDNGPEQLPTFYRAERFRKRLYRPDVIKLLFETGSLAEALKLADAAKKIATRTANLEELVPPRAELLVVDQTQLPKVKLKVQAQAASSAQPIRALRLMLDGRIVPGEETRAEFTPGQTKAEVEWTFELPEGEHQLAVLARGSDASAVSPAVPVKFRNVQKLPVLHVLTVGINTYKDPAFDLRYAADDAKALAAAFAQHCKGKDAAFRDVKAKTILDANATTEAIKKALEALRKDVSQSDLVVFFFAGHGAKQKKDYYLLTHEANVNKLAETSLSGDDLRKELSNFKCQVLLMLDACHAAGFGPGKKLTKLGLKPAVDDVVRDFTDDEYGIAVLCAAMAHEKATEIGGHGLFTRAVLDALAKKPGVPFNARNHRLYVHHLHSYVFDEVSGKSDERQHPFLSLPWTVESFVVR